MKFAIEEFIAYLKYERGRAENTCVAYARDLRQFADYLDSCGVLVPEEITVEHLIGFLRDRIGTQAERTQARKIASIRHFLKYMFEEERLQKDIAGMIDTVRPWKKLPKSISERDVNRIIASPVEATIPNEISDETMRERLRIRNTAILATLYAAGARVSEVCDMRMEWLHLNEGVVRLEGKGSKQRIVPLGEVAVGAIRLYLQMSRPGLRTHPIQNVFLNRRGKRISRQQIYRIVKRYSAAAGIPEISPHSFRHACATHLLQGGANLRAVQMFLGHANITTTEIYTHVDQHRLTTAHQQFHPRSRAN